MIEIETRPIQTTVPLVRPEGGTNLPGTSSIIFLNARRASSQRVERHRPVEGYRHASEFFHCGIIDRTQTLDQGFPYAVLDPIPEQKEDSTTFGELCDTMGTEIVSKAIESSRGIRVLWSGGIDSTSALISLMKASQAANRPDLLEVFYSSHSLAEYPSFYEQHIRDNYPSTMIDGQVAKTLDTRYINVTGEHGDQLFGSMVLEPYVKKGVAQQSYQDTLPGVVFDHLQDGKKTDQVMDYLEPQIQSAVMPVTTLFDALWWINYSMKWQHVTLRLPAFSDNARGAYESLEHFFRDGRFQNWSLTHPEIRQVEDWRKYKDEAKRYILDYTGDIEYYNNKTKEGSLKNVMRGTNGDTPVSYRIHMTDNFQPRFIADDRSMPKQQEFE